MNRKSRIEVIAPPRVAGKRRARRVRETTKAMFRTAILDAAEEVFASSGFYGAKVHDIAARAGVAVGTIYNHFGQKEDVLLALLRQRMAETEKVLAPAPDDPAGFEAKLIAVVERLLAYTSRHVAFFSVAVEHGLLGDATSAAKRILAGRPLPHAGRNERAWLELVDEGIAAGAVAPLDRELAAAFLKHTLRSVARWARKTGKMPLAEQARSVVALFLRGAGGG